MTSTASAIRQMLDDSARVVATHKPSYTHVAAWRDLVLASSDEEVLRLVNTHLSPHADAVKTRNIVALSSALPQYELESLHDALPQNVRDKLWADLGMLIMLIGTVSLVPPEMLKQIEGFASTMASSMQSGNFNPADLGGALSSMFGASMPSDEPVPNARRRVRRGNAAQRGAAQRNAQERTLTAQEKFRKTLV